MDGGIVEEPTFTPNGAGLHYESALDLMFQCVQQESILSKKITFIDTKTLPLHEDAHPRGKDYAEFYDKKNDIPKRIPDGEETPTPYFKKITSEKIKL